MAGYPVDLISATSLIMIQYLSTHAEVDRGEETTVVRRNHLSDQPIKPFILGLNPGVYILIFDIPPFEIRVFFLFLVLELHQISVYQIIL